MPPLPGPLPVTTYPDDLVPYGWMEPCERRRQLILAVARYDQRTRDLITRRPEILATA
jgi:hypothetical protein